MNYPEQSYLYDAFEISVSVIDPEPGDHDLNEMTCYIQQIILAAVNPVECSTWVSPTNEMVTGSMDSPDCPSSISPLRLMFFKSQVQEHSDVYDPGGIPVNTERKKIKIIWRDRLLSKQQK